MVKVRYIKAWEDKEEGEITLLEQKEFDKLSQQGIVEKWPREKNVAAEIIEVRGKGLSTRKVDITGWKVDEYVNAENGNKKRIIERPDGVIYLDLLGIDNKHTIIEIKPAKQKKEPEKKENDKQEEKRKKAAIEKKRLAREEEELERTSRTIAEAMGQDPEVTSLRAKVLMKLLLRKPDATGEAVQMLMKYIVDKQQLITIRHDKNPATYYYEPKEGIYLPQGNTRIKILLDAILMEAYTTYIAKEVLERIKINTFVDADVITKIQDPYKIVCANGVINLQTLELEPFSPIPRQFQRIPIAYNKYAECPAFTKFIEEVLPEKDKRDAVQEYIGYALLRNNRYEKYMLLYGSGANGKTILLNVIKECFGRENISSVKPQLLSSNKDPYATADLEKSLINIAGEISDETIRDSTSIKETASPETIRVRNPYETAKNVMPHAKHIWSANKLPKIKDQSDGMWRRILPIEFSSKYVDEHELETIRTALPPHLQKNVHVKDVNLLDKLTTKEELEGVLQWAINGYKRLSENGGFSYGGTPQELRLDYNKKADSISAFFEEVVSEAITDSRSCPKKKMYDAYCMYCNYLGVTASSETQFGIHCKKVENLREERMSANPVSGSTMRPRGWVTIDPDKLIVSLSRVVQGFSTSESIPAHILGTFQKTGNPGGMRLNELSGTIYPGLPSLSSGGQIEKVKALFSGKYLNKILPSHFIIAETGISDEFLYMMKQKGDITEVTENCFILN